MKTCKRKNYYPKWAKYKAIDADGDLYLYSELPIQRNDVEWFPTQGEIMYIKRKKNYKGDWKKSLRKIED